MARLCNVRKKRAVYDKIIIQYASSKCTYAVNIIIIIIIDITLERIKTKKNNNKHKKNKNKQSRNAK